MATPCTSRCGGITALLFCTSLTLNGQIVELDTDFGTDGYYTMPDVGVQSASFTTGSETPDGGVVLLTVFQYQQGQDQSTVQKALPNGTTDTSWGNGGTYIEGVDPSANGTATCLAVQPDGKVLVAGEGSDGSTKVLYVYRLTQQGTRDTSFGIAGKTRIPHPWYSAGLLDITVDVAGRILLTGVADFKILVVRLLPNGTLDTTYGVNGFARWAPFGHPAYARQLAVLPNGEAIVVGGLGDFMNSYAAVVSKLSADGALDLNFATNGYHINMDPDDDGAAGLDLEMDESGSIRFLGYRVNSQPAYTREEYIEKLLPNGSVDGSFGVGGRASTVFTNNSPSRALREIVYSGAGHCTALAHLSNGSLSLLQVDLDGNFIDLTAPGTWTEISYPSGYFSFVRTLILHSSGRLLVASKAGPLSVRTLTGLRVLEPLATGVAPSQQEEASIAVWPNPASTHFSVTYSSQERIASVELYNALGLRVRAYPGYDATYPLDGSLANGVYRLRVETAGQERMLPLVIDR